MTTLTDHACPDIFAHVQGPDAEDFSRHPVTVWNGMGHPRMDRTGYATLEERKHASNRRRHYHLTPVALGCRRFLEGRRKVNDCWPTGKPVDNPAGRSYAA